MPIYYCKAVDAKGKTSEFYREALSEDILIRELSANDVFPISIKKTDETLKQISRKKRKFSRGSIIEFTDTLSLLLSSGLTLKDALEVAQTIYGEGAVNEIIVHLLEKIKGGAPFYNVLEELGDSFPPIYRGLVKIGEKVGSMEVAYERLATYLKREKKLKEKITGSLLYPAMILSIAFVGIIVMVTFVLPKIRGIFSELGFGLPQRIESMMSVFNLFITAGALLVIGVVMTVLLFIIGRRREGKLAEFLDRMILKIPIIGRISFYKENLTFLFAMETLTGGGFTVEDALQEAGRVVENRAFRNALVQAREDILKGKSLSSAFVETPIFPQRLCRWIGIGEKSGQMEKAFSQLHHYYQGEIEKWYSGIMNLIEPIMILCVGAIIFFIIIFFVMPIFSIYSTM